MSLLAKPRQVLLLKAMMMEIPPIGGRFLICPGPAPRSVGLQEASASPFLFCFVGDREN
jgi:hypothetical protein